MDAVEGGTGLQVSDLHGRRVAPDLLIFFLLHFHCILYFLALVLKPPFWREFRDRVLVFQSGGLRFLETVPVGHNVWVVAAWLMLSKLKLWGFNLKKRVLEY